MQLQSNYRSLTSIALFNLAIIAFLGVIMRYKIGFDFPFLNQKNLLHAHSHFAFAGWVSHALMTLLVYRLNKSFSESRRGVMLIYANLICAYGMLLFFAIQGYGPISLFFSTASILVSWLFALFYFRQQDQSAGAPWIKTALIFNIISAAGTFYLAYMMSHKNITQHHYLGSVYYYLHFQYNGWFFFACMGLFTDWLSKVLPEKELPKYTFPIFALACIPAYFLSVLWVPVSNWIYVLVVVASIAQLIAWFLMIRFLLSNKQEIQKHLNPLSGVLLQFAGVALTIKLLLQAGSVIPEISKLAFGFRTIVIAYLHLVLLGVISVFLLGYIYLNKLIRNNKYVRNGIMIFIGGIFLNEMVLLIQGLASFSYTVIPFADVSLLLISSLMLSGLILILAGNLKAETGTK
ncbi:MAG: hypothetical protein IPP34_05210 [Bacteroidetes bacterium]|nr:hypothetical protein [Bacteroidota bacterium]